MKYNKYGEAIENESKQLSGQRRKAVTIMLILQALLVVLNVVILVIPSLMGFLCFILAPAYRLFFVSLVKGLTALEEEGYSVKAYNPVKFGLLIAYAITAILCIFK